MNNKTIKQKIEKFLHSKRVVFTSEEDKKNNYFFIRLLMNHNFDVVQNGIQIELYKRFIILNILGWEILEKIPDEDAKTLQIFDILDKFLSKEMKIKVYLKNNKPYFWKIFRFHHHCWQLYGHHGKPFRFPWQQKTTAELDIDSLIVNDDFEHIKEVTHS